MKTKMVYISGADKFPPQVVKSALDEIRQNLGLSDEYVLFGIPVDEAEDMPEPQVVTEHKVLKFPTARRGSILGALENPAKESEHVGISDIPLVVNDEDFDSDAKITDLLNDMPSLSDDSTPVSQANNLVEEFADFLDKEEPEPAKIKPFKSKKKAFTNALGDLFNFGGNAANDDAQGYSLPDFIKRP